MIFQSRFRAFYSTVAKQENQLELRQQLFGRQNRMRKNRLCQQQNLLVNKSNQLVPIFGDTAKTFVNKAG